MKILPLYFYFLICLFIESRVYAFEPGLRLPTKSYEEISDLQIEFLESPTTLIASGSAISPSKGQVLAIQSQKAEVQIIGFVEIIESKIRNDGKVEVKAKILRVSNYYMVRPGDLLVQLDLTKADETYKGHTDLFVRAWSGPDISARYRPLFTQGFSIGETAQTLHRDEILVGVYGNLSYGISNRLTVGTFLTGFLFESANGNLKYRAIENDSDTVSFGTSFTKKRESDSTALNLTLYWDSVTSDKMVSHTLISFAIATFKTFDDLAAIKTAGSSSFQTGYEYVLDSWDRVLFGPNYNFELKTLGGYVAYKKVWNQFHLSGSLSSVDVRELKMDPKTGYVALLEAYWRF